MKRLCKPMSIVLGITAGLAMTACVAYEAKPVSPSAICERDVLGVCMLPPLPPPTAAQLKKGRELLEKIVYVIDNVALSDEVGVMKVFGFTDLYAYESPGNEKYAPYREVGPKGKREKLMLPDELIGTGFTYLTVQPWVKDKTFGTLSRLNGTISKQEACISIDDVRTKFSTISKTSQSYLVTDIHPVERPPRLHQTGHLVFSDIQAFKAALASASFTFNYQFCAQSFGTGYRNN